MSAKQELQSAYATWEQLTHAEGAAIGGTDWDRVAECQGAKRALQQQILRLTEAAQVEYIDAGLGVTAFDGEFRPIINQLIQLEVQNSAILAERRQAAELARAELDHSAQNLRRVQKSYAPPPAALWNSYS